MSNQVEHLDVPFPNDAPIRMYLANRHGLNVTCFATVKVSDRVYEGGDTGVIHGANVATCRPAVTRRDASSTRAQIEKGPLPSSAEFKRAEAFVRNGRRKLTSGTDEALVEVATDIMRAVHECGVQATDAEIGVWGWTGKLGAKR